MSQSNGNGYEAQSVDAEGNEYFSFANGYSLLSNYHYTPFNVDGVRFLSMEQFLWANKATVSGDFEAYQNIMDERTSARYKEIKIKNINYDRWNALRSKILLIGLEAKFRQCYRAAEKLRSTGDKYLVHTTVRDRIYGTGLELNDPNNCVPSKWQGLNELGKALMEIRNVIAQ